ncbi:hypothetical protein GCM10027435_04520 [Haloparvum alkalitolerans]|uniref:tetratricopeptide repeat protein n=1 Tax=Haloparvum alkalitolerans TaxID=1042953 RepID=UPI003CFBAADF
MAELSDDLVDRIEARADESGTDDLIELFGDLPPETDREWELALTRLIEVAPDRKEDLRRVFESDDFGQSDPETVRFAAFFAYCTFLRRRGNISEFGRVLEKHAEFDDHPMYPHLQGLQAKQLRTGESYERAIEYARRAQSRVGPDHAGVNHAYVTAIVQALEEDKEEFLGTPREQLLEEAEGIMDQLITEPVYPKFKVTLGRLRALQGRYDDAIRQINEGIDLEDDSKDSYVLRVNSYRNHESRVYLDKYVDEIQRRQDQLKEDVDDALEAVETAQEESKDQIKKLQGQTLQFLGFFATLLAVIISTVTITLEFSILPATALIVVLIGGLLIAFGGFTVMLPVDRALRKGSALFLMGLFTAGLGFAVAASIAGVV